MCPYKCGLLEIKIKDNGVGMDEEFLKDVKNPFKTTKTTRKWGLVFPSLKHLQKMLTGNLL